jgi:heme/copper-type cytochrome/quinol oxidase subunit 2
MRHIRLTHLGVCKLALLSGALVFLSTNLVDRDALFVLFTVSLDLALLLWSIVYEVLQYCTKQHRATARNASLPIPTRGNRGSPVGTVIYAIFMLAFMAILTKDLVDAQQVTRHQDRVFRRVGMAVTVWITSWLYTFELLVDPKPNPNTRQEDLQSSSVPVRLYVGVSLLFFVLQTMEVFLSTTPFQIVLPSVQMWTNVLLLTFLPPFIHRSCCVTTTTTVGGGSRSSRSSCSSCSSRIYMRSSSVTLYVKCSGVQQQIQ